MELKRKKIILAVGALKKEKSYENLIKSYAKILIKYPEYQLNIAGDGYLKNDLIKLVKDLKIKKKVKFLGNLNKNELVEIYNKSEIFVLSSSSEGFPKVVLEAILCGCRVIATNVGSITEFMPAEYIIPDCSVNNIYKYLDKILNTADYNINIEELKNKYSWQNVITKYKNTYESYVR